MPESTIIALKTLRYEGVEYEKDEALEPPPTGRLLEMLLEHRYVAKKAATPKPKPTNRPRPVNRAKDPEE